ncbi:MAG: NTPase [Candidatus Bathyarchaeota archaeon]|nr:NTPase [Candidatus Bathyarchaeota archaeon]
MNRIFFLTGRPGVGKTTVLLKTIEELRKRGFTVGGFVSQEAREGGSRVGFKIVDLCTGREGWLAHVRQPRGPKIGKYRVCLEDLESVGVNAILDAAEKADITVIDEVGPMELFSQAFGEAVTKALKSGKPVLGTVHYRARDSLVVMIKNRKDAEVIEVTKRNRDGLAEAVVREISENLGRI